MVSSEPMKKWETDSDVFSLNYECTLFLTRYLLLLSLKQCNLFSLEEYLQELAGIHPQQLEKIAETVVSTDSDSSTGDNDVPNFAHAALLVQNSSNVYSRKVEYLYTLVYKALEDFFRASTTSSSSSKRRTKGVDADIEEFYEYDPNECFLLLDDVVPEDLSPTHKKINLKEGVVLWKN